MKEFRMIIAVLLLLQCSVGIQIESCPDDSIITENGECKCVSPCFPGKCDPGLRPVQVRPGAPDTPGNCCPLYNCLPPEGISWVATDENSQGLGSCMDSSGVPRAAGERWQEGPCVNCSCEENHVACQATMCRGCENPTPPQAGECCPRCPLQGNATGIVLDKCEPLMNCELHCTVGFGTDSSGCPICKCVDEKLVSEEFSAVEKTCPQLSDCTLNCKLADDDGGCPVCACVDSSDSGSTVVSIISEENEDAGEPETPKKKKVCPALSCDLHCERGLAIDEDGCTLCACNPKPGCPIFNCKKDCPLGYKSNKRGCQICRCRLSCIDSRNETHSENSKWSPDTCTTCICDQGGRLSCNTTVCSVPCKKPLPPPPGECCQICPTKDYNETESSPGGMKGWAHVTVTVVLAALCIGLTIHAVRGRFRARLSPSEASYASAYPNQYYKYIPTYDTPVHQNEKIVRL